MIYLHLIVEGETERRFAIEILAPYLGFDYCIDVSLITTSRDRGRGRVYKGGLGSYEKVKREITNRIKQYPESDDQVFSTMFDLYALPTDFPGYSDAQKILDPYKKVKELENAFAEDIACRRFTPYIQLHEFEAMVFVAPSELQFQYPDSENKIAALQRVLNERAFKENPELINEGETTAPSKRIIQCFPSYERSKPFVGVNTVERIGIEAIRDKCFHFNDWLHQLKSLKTFLLK